MCCDYLKKIKLNNEVSAVEWNLNEQRICKEGLFNNSSFTKGNIIYEEDYIRIDDISTKQQKQQQIKTLRFNTTNSLIGLDRKLKIQKDNNGIITLQGQPLESYERQKIKDYFKYSNEKEINKNPKEFAMLYYATIMNKKQYPDINILVPDDNIKYKKGKEVDKTIEVINKIPKSQRSGKFIIYCDWLKNGEMVNLVIDFKNKSFEIINTNTCIDQDIINNLQKKLRKKLKNSNWKVFESNIVETKTNNAIASTIVTTERAVLRQQMKQNTINNKKLKQQIKKLEQEQKEIECDLKKEQEVYKNVCENYEEAKKSYEENYNQYRIKYNKYKTELKQHTFEIQNFENKQYEEYRKQCNINKIRTS